MAAQASQHYSGPAKFLHWTMAIVILIALLLGIMIANFDWAPVKGILKSLSAMTGTKVGPLKNQLYDLHRSFGALILALIALRIAWRLISPPPPLPDTIRPWQRFASKLVHGVLYLCMLIMPFLGWIGTSLYGAKITVFGVFVLPALVAKDRPSSGFVLDAHGWLGIIFGICIVIHVGAALMHHFVEKDDVLRRMLPGRRG